jgi:predicted XRE-type DNA-binding protein
LSVRNHNNNQHKFKIEERRKQVACLLARSLTQTEIARRLGVDQSTVSDDIKALKEMSQRFIYDLAKSDLHIITKVVWTASVRQKKEAWAMYDSWNAASSALLIYSLVKVKCSYSMQASLHAFIL